MPVALTVVLSDRQSGAGLGHALICPDARYASIAWRGADRLDRLYVPSADWKLLEHDLAVGLPATVLPIDGAVARILLPPARRSNIAVHYLSELPIALEELTAAQQLDALLRQISQKGPADADHSTTDSERL